MFISDIDNEKDEYAIPIPDRFSQYAFATPENIIRHEHP